MASVYNIELRAPFITVLPYDTVELSQLKGQLATVQVQQIYHGCVICTELDIVGYKKTTEDANFTANGFVYGLIKDTQIVFYWNKTEVIPPS